MDGIKDGAGEGMELTSYADSPSDQPSPDSGNKRRKADITISTKDSHIVTYSAPLHAVKPWGGSEGMFGIHAHTIHRAICLVFCFIYLMNS